MKEMIIMLRVIKNIIMFLILHILWIFPIHKYRILFMSYGGKYYNDNPKALSDYLKDIKHLDIIWVVENTDCKEDNIHFVNKSSLSYLYYLATSAMWIDNCRKASWVRKRNGQYYIQMWHGGIPLKMVEKDAEQTLPSEHIRCAKNDSKMANLMISNCSWKTELIHRAFWYDGEILSCGTPRLDSYFSSQIISYRQKCEKAHLNPNYKYILYAPTFRNSESLEPYDIDFIKVCSELKKVTGYEWKVLYRLHPNIKRLGELIVGTSVVLNMTDYPDLYELLDVSEILITDYSSVMFEGGFLGKYVALYCSDYNDYLKERALYFDIKKLPYDFTTNMEQLMNYIRNYNSPKYKAALNDFNKQLQVYEDGNSCEQLSYRIMRYMNLEVK